MTVEGLGGERALDQLGGPFQPEGPSSTDPAPLAGVLSMLAVVVIVIALAISAL